MHCHCHCVVVVVVVVVPHGSPCFEDDSVLQPRAFRDLEGVAHGEPDGVCGGGGRVRGGVGVGVRLQ